MALRWFDSWAYARGFGSNALRKYDWATRFIQLNVLDDRSAKPESAALEIFNTAFDGFALSKTIGESSVWFVGFDMSINWTYPLNRDNVFFRIESGPPNYTNLQTPNTNTALTLNIGDDGVLHFNHWSNALMDGTNEAKGLPILTPPLPLVPADASNPTAANDDNRWVYVEFRVDFDLGELDIRFDGKLVASVGGIDFGIDAIGTPDRFSIYWEDFASSGVVLANLYVADGSNDARGNKQDFLGPCRVTTHMVAADGICEWHRNTGLSDHSAVDDIPCNDDGTYIEGNLNEHEWFATGSIDIDRRIVGVSMCATGRRKDSGTTSPTAMTVKYNPPFGTDFLLQGDKDWQNAYTIMQTPPLEYSPFFMGQRFTADEIQKCWWGLFAPGPGKARVTQVWVEILTSLKASGKSGGSFSYSF